jgi:Uma2 family endonuclease
MSHSAVAEPRAPIAADAGRTPVRPVSEAGRVVSEDTYWREYYFESDIHYEWNRGRLEEKPVSDYETYLVYHWFMALLGHFLKARPIAKLVALEMGFRLPLPDGVVIRKPDFGVVRNDNPQPLLPHDHSYHGVYDLCVEALSDRKKRDITRDTVTKKAEYAAGGVPEYYILHYAAEHQAFLTRTEAGAYAPIEAVDGVIHSRVLPGFRFRLSDLAERRDDEALRDDPVYGDFVLPRWREDRERAAAEARRAEAEAERAEAEAERADAAAQRAEAEAAARAEAEERAREAEAALARLRARIEDQRNP